MRFVLEDTDIFDEEIENKLTNLLIENKSNFVNGQDYNFEITFSVNLLEDVRFDQFIVPATKEYDLNERSDRIYALVSSQLEKMQKVIEDNSIVVYHSDIKGDEIDSDNILIIEFSEDDYEPEYNSSGKERKRYKVSSISPNQPGLRKKIVEVFSRLRETHKDM